MKKRICALLLALLLLSCTAYCEPELCPYDIQNSLYYRTLSGPAQIFIDDLYDAVMLGERRVEIPEGMTADDIYPLTWDFYREFQELCSYHYGLVNDDDENEPIWFEVFYRKSTDEQKKFINMLAKKANELESAEDVHDYLVDRLEYDYDSLAEDGSVANEDAAYGYECLHRKKAICAGYASCFATLCHFAGIKASYVAGMAGDGLHAWNVVLTGDRGYRFVDATWDDCSNNELWRLVTPEAMSVDHTSGERYEWVDAMIGG